MNVKNELTAAYCRAYEETPGLQRFDHLKKWFLWGMFALAVLQKVLTASVMIERLSLPLLLGMLIGLSIPGVFAIAVYRGPWKLSCIFYLLAAYVLFDLLNNGLPALTSGVTYIPMFYIMFAFESVYAVYLLALALWLTVPAKNRLYAQKLNGVFAECSRMMKENGGVRRL